MFHGATTLDLLRKCITDSSKKQGTEWNGLENTLHRKPTVSYATGDTCHRRPTVSYATGVLEPSNFDFGLISHTLYVTLLKIHTANGNGLYLVYEKEN